MRLLLLLLPCAWALTIPPQPALVCPDLFNYYPDLISYLSGFLYGGDQPDTADYSEMYCTIAQAVICYQNSWTPLILNPSIIIPSAQGAFKGTGMNFDVYSTGNASNTYINMQNLSCDYANTCNSVQINSASLDLSNKIPITSSFTARAIQTANDYYGIYYSSPTKLALFYPANLAFNASGINCNQPLPVNGTPPIISTAPFKMTPTPAVQAKTTPAPTIPTPSVKSPATPPPAPSPSTTDNTNTIVGAVVGTVIGLLVLIALFFLVKHFAPTPLESRYPPTPYTPLGVRYQPVPYYHPMR